MTGFLRYFRRYWQGDFPFLLGVGINLLGLRLLLSMVDGSGGAWTHAFLVLSGAVLVWQVVGGLRLADQVVSSSGDQLAALAAQGAVLAVVIMTGWQAVSLTWPAPPPPDVDHAAVPAAPGRLPMDRQGQVAILHGDISYDMMKSLAVTLAEAPDLAMLRLDSDGGNIYAARGIAKLVRQQRLAVVVERHCFSACTLVFLAGRARYLGPSGSLGFHGYSIDANYPVPTSNVAREEHRDRAAFAADGVAAAFIDRAYATPASTLWRPNRTELLAAGVLRIAAR
jgi:hypothetical protein